MSVNIYDKENDTLIRIAGGTLYSEMPVGTISPFGGSAIPSGYLLCNGAEVLKTTYAELYAVIGDVFGTASDNTKFKLPDLREATTKGVGLNGKSNIHYDSDGVALGEFVEDRLQDHKHRTLLYNMNFQVGSENIAPVTENGGSGIGIVGDIVVGRHGNTTEVKAVGVNYIIKAKYTPVPADFIDAVDEAVEEVYSDIIPSNAGSANKLVTRNDIVTRHNYSVTGTTDAIADTKALVNHIVTSLDVGTYAGEFKRSGITFGSYRLTYFIDGVYAKSVSGIVTYSINVNTDATYQVSYIEDIEHGTPPVWKIEKLTSEELIALTPMNNSTIFYNKSRIVGGLVTVCASITVPSGNYLVKENAVANIPNFGTGSIGYILPCLYRNTGNGSEEPGYIIIQTDGNLYPYYTKTGYNEIRINASYSSKV